MFKTILYTFLILPLNAFAQQIPGRITRIIDGDTFLFETSDSTFTVYLYGIEAPEKDQLYGPQAIANMETYLWHDAVINIQYNINQPGVSAILYIGNKNINHQLVKEGNAWYNRLHCINAELAYAERRASEKRLGLWADDSPTPPWDFRKGVLAHPLPPKNGNKVLICTHQRATYYHKRYCPTLSRCHANIIVVKQEQAEFLNMKPCKHCYPQSALQQKLRKFIPNWF